LNNINNEFLVKCYYSFSDNEYIYFVMEYLNGGDLSFFFNSFKTLKEEVVKTYAAEIILACEYLHSKDIIHRDLKPENILLDSEGHISLTDFGFAKESIGSDQKTRTFCGTLEYMSPEMIKGTGYGKATDWWSVGILIFDMLTGEPPFRHKNEGTLQQKILKDKIHLPNYLSSETHSIMKGLLNRDDKKRLGSGVTGTQEIKNHSFFKGVNWKKYINKEVDPPFRPSVPKGMLDISNFDDDFTKQPAVDSPVPSMLSKSQDQLFFGFSYVRTPSPFLPEVSNKD